MRQDRVKKLESILEPRWWRITKGFFKNNVKLIIYLCLIALSINFYYLGNKYSNEKITRCGKIIDMKQPETKGGSVYNIIYVRYDDTKNIEDINVTNSTYYDSKVGQTICFEFETKNGLSAFYYIFASIIACVILVWSISHLVENNIY